MAGSDRIPGAPSGVLLRPGVADLAVYVPGASTGVPEGVPIVKLSSNEGAEGPLPAARAALEAEAGELHRYPDSQPLVRAIAERRGLPEEMVTVGPGADMLIQYIASAFLEPGREVVYAWPSFVSYALTAQKQSAHATTVPLRGDDVHDLDAMRAAITERTALVYVCNPNNPTGTYVSRDALRAFVDDLPEHVVCVVDEAYAEYVLEDDYPDVLEEYVKAGHPRVAVLHTFSKIHGLAGLRVGWMAAPAWLVDASVRVRGPFDVTSAGLAAAIASIAEEDALRERAEANARRRESLRARLAAAGVESTGVANFLTVRVPDAQAATAALMRRGVIVRPLNAFGSPTQIRITIGSDADMAIAEPIIAEVLGAGA
ncbi:MAG: pyridoxal phosphate-dependent aminotransferase [Actinomycetota bacterium]